MYRHVCYGRGGGRSAVLSSQGARGGARGGYTRPGTYGRGQPPMQVRCSGRVEQVMGGKHGNVHFIQLFRDNLISLES